MRKKILLTISILVIMITIPIAFSYVPQGKTIWFNVSPATNETLGGIYAFDCPSGELAFAIYENGSFACATP